MDRQDNTQQWQQPDRGKKVDKPYMNIPYLDSRRLDFFTVGEYIWVEEKIDGSNISARIDEQGNFRAFGRRFELSTDYTNRGAYEWLLKLENKIRNNFGDKYTFYFEWLVMQAIKYEDKYYNRGYLISVKDNTTNKYLSEDKVFEIAKILEVDIPPLLYSGEFISMEHLRNMVGTTTMGSKVGEGIVVKAMTSDGTQKMLKIVHEEFAEKKKYDMTKRINKIKAEESKIHKASEIVTDARINKAILRMVEDGLVGSTENIDESQKKIIIKNIGRYIINDCMKEEPEFIKEFGKDFGNYAFRLCKGYIERRFT